MLRNTHQVQYYDNKTPMATGIRVPTCQNHSTRPKETTKFTTELLAMICALTDWRHYLVGSPHTVTVLADHQNLTYFRTTQKLNQRQARWSLFLADFNLQLVHLPGKQMVQSDALSRRPDHYSDTDTDNEDRVLLPGDLFVRTLDLDLHDLIAETGK